MGSGDTPAVRKRAALLGPVLALAAFAACASESEPTAVGDGGAAEDASGLDASAPLPTGKAARCASTFGKGLSRAFGRLDGTLLAVVTPSDTQCVLSNSDHLVIEVEMSGSVYRLVVNIQSDGRNGTDTRLRYQELRHVLVGAPFSEGWHPGVTLDYASDLGAHSVNGFVAQAMPELIQRVSDQLALGSHLSVFASSSGGTRADSAHLVHHNASAPGTDGALVVDPESADPTWLLFHFDGDVF